MTVAEMCDLKSMETSNPKRQRLRRQSLVNSMCAPLTVSDKLSNLPSDLLLAVFHKCGRAGIGVRAACRRTRDLSRHEQEQTLDECEQLLATMRELDSIVGGKGCVRFAASQYPAYMQLTLWKLALKIDMMGLTFRAYEPKHQVVLRAATAVFAFYKCWSCSVYFRSTQPSGSLPFNRQDATFRRLHAFFRLDPNLAGLDWTRRRRVLEYFHRDALALWHVYRSTANRAMATFRATFHAPEDNVFHLDLRSLRGTHTDIETESPFVFPVRGGSGKWIHTVAVRVSLVEDRLYSPAAQLRREANDRKLVRELWLASVGEEERRAALALCDEARRTPRRADSKRRSAIKRASIAVTANATRWWNSLHVKKQMQLMARTVHEQHSLPW